MTVYYDTAAPGSAGPLVASGQVFYFGRESKFYLSVASNLISGQATGQAVQFTIYSHKNGVQPLQVAYGTTNTTYAVEYTGYLILASVPAGASVSCRVVVSSDPFPLTVTTVSATITGAVAVTGSVFNTPLSALGSPVTIYGVVAAPTIGGQAVNGSASAASLTVAPSVSAGQLVAVVIGLAGNATVNTVVDSQSNPYTKQSASQQTLNGIVMDIEVWTTPSAASTGTDTITVTPSATCGIALLGISLNASAFDVAGATVVMNGNNSGSASCSVTSTSVNDIVLSFAWRQATLGFANPSGYTATSSESTPYFLQGGYLLNAPTGLNTATWTWNSGLPAYGQIVSLAFKPTGAVPIAIDSNGRLILGAGTQAIGTVGVTALPSIPAGANAIGTVGVTALPAIPAGSNSIGTVKTAPLATLGVTNSFAPTSIAATTAETVEGTAGGVAVVIGTRVFFALSCAGADDAVTAVSGAFVYVALKGVTSGRYYAMAQYGEALQGHFDAPQSENVEIVVRNSLVTGAVVMHGAFWSMSP